MRMAAFLFFAFVFASQLIGGLNTKLPPPSYGNAVTILNIDGGGIKGIIPSIILQHLEKALKALDKEATLAGYFDVISGVSTGGIITGLLTKPDPSDPTRPEFGASDALNFYLDYGPSIFNESLPHGRLPWLPWNDKLTPWPKYDGEFLHDKAREIFGDTRLHQTVTNVVIPTFDVNKYRPVIFSNLKLKTVPSLDAKLADICIGTSAAPTLLPPYYFKDGDNEFNLIDGAVAVASPTMVAVNEVLQQQIENNSDFIPMKVNGHTKIILLSLGCGIVKPPSYNATDLKNKSGLDWAKILVDAMYASAGHSGDYVTSVAMESSVDNYYLRIEEYNLDPTIAKDMDNATQKNLANLVKVGEDLLKQPVKTLNTISFLPEEKPSEETNAEAIEKLAEILYNEKQFRLKKKKSMEKMGRPFIELPFST